MNAYEVYKGSDGELTRRFYAELERRGPIGVIAMNLFRASKCSARAKLYRGGIRGVRRYKDKAYERKDWSLRQLCEALVEHGPALGIRFGWGRDDLEGRNPWVLYVELPGAGPGLCQVSFHSPVHHAGPDYGGHWDGMHLSSERIIAFAQRVIDEVAHV